MVSLVVRNIIALALSLFCVSASASVLDWSAVTWSPGSLSNSLDVEPAHPGNDVTVTVSGDVGVLQSEPPQTPAVTTNLQGGRAVTPSTLTLLVDFSNQTQAVTVKVDFSSLAPQGVANVTFKIFDVDFASSNGNSGANFQDELRSITALSIDGATLIAPTITISPNNVLSGTGLNQAVDGIALTSDTGATSGDANVTISFGTNVIQSFTFTYGSGSGTNSDPTQQHIGLDNIDFAIVPETDATFLMILLCAAAITVASWQRARKSRRPAEAANRPKK